MISCCVFVVKPDKLFMKQSRWRKEQGFTILELLVVVVIISILATISLVAHGSQQRHATDATVRSDLVSNRNDIIGSRGGLYKTGAQLSEPTLSNTNTFTYMWSKDQTVACVMVQHVYSPLDSTEFYYSSQTGKIGEGECDALGNTVTYPTKPVVVTEQPVLVTKPAPTVTPTVTAPPTTPPTTTPTTSPTPVTPSPEPEETGGVYAVNKKVTENTRTRVCFALNVTTESVKPIPYQIDIPTANVPFTAKVSSADYDLHEGRIKWFTSSTQPGGTLNYTGTHQLTTVSKDAPLDLTLCIPQYNPMINYDQGFISRKNVNGNQWYATQQFTITSDAEFYTNWSLDIDLTELKKTVSGKPNDKARVNDSRVKLEWLQGNIYRLSPANKDSTMKANDSITLDFAVG